MSQRIAWSRAARLLPWGLAVALLLIVVAPAAMALAASPPEVVDGQVQLPVAPGSVLGSILENLGWSPRPDDYTPLLRWGTGIMSYHSKIGDLDVVSQATNGMRNLNWMMTTGIMQALWISVHFLLRFTVGLDLFSVIGRQIDQFLSTIVDAVVAPKEGVSLALVALLIAIVAAFWGAARASRGTSNWWKRPVSVALMIGVLAAMGAGAQQSFEQNDDEGQPGYRYQAVFPSPGWLLQTTAGGVNLVTTTLAGAFGSDGLPASVAGVDRVSAGGEGDFRCPQMLMGMRTLRDSAVKDRVGDGDTLSAAEAAARDGYLLSDVVSTMWADIALTTFRQAQYGNETDFGDRAYCHQLEWQSSRTKSDQELLLSQSLSEEGASGSALTSPGTTTAKDVGGAAGQEESGDDARPRSPQLQPSTTREKDVSLVHWSLCRTNNGGKDWVVNPAAKPHLAKPDELKDDCINWWNDPTAAQENGLNIAPNYNDDDMIVNDNPRTANFFNTLHGVNGGGFASWMILTAFSIGTIAATGVLFLVTGAVLLAKLLGMAFLVGFIFVLITGMFRRDGWEALMKSFMQMLGSQIIAMSAVLLLTLVAFFTRILSNIGASFFEPGTPMQLLWTGLSPAGAVTLLAVTFVKFLKLPNPFSLKGGLAFASAAGAVGGGMVGGMIGSRRGGAGGTGGGDSKQAVRESLGLDELAAARNALAPGGPRRTQQGMDGGLRRPRPGGTPGGGASSALQQQLGKQDKAALDAYGDKFGKDGGTLKGKAKIEAMQKHGIALGGGDKAKVAAGNLGILAGAVTGGAIGGGVSGAAARSMGRAVKSEARQLGASRKDARLAGRVARHSILHQHSRDQLERFRDTAPGKRLELLRKGAGAESAGQFRGRDGTLQTQGRLQALTGGKLTARRTQKMEQLAAARGIDLAKLDQQAAGAATPKERLAAEAARRQLMGDARREVARERRQQFAKQQLPKAAKTLGATALVVGGGGLIGAAVVGTHLARSQGRFVAERRAREEERMQQLRIAEGRELLAQAEDSSETQDREEDQHATPDGAEERSQGSGKQGGEGGSSGVEAKEPEPSNNTDEF